MTLFVTHTTLFYEKYSLPEFDAFISYGYWNKSIRNMVFHQVLKMSHAHFRYFVLQS